MTNKETPKLIARSATVMLQQKPLSGVAAVVVFWLLDILQTNAIIPSLGQMVMPDGSQIPLDLAIAAVVAGLVMWLVPPKAGETVVKDESGVEYRMQPVQEDDTKDG